MGVKKFLQRLSKPTRMFCKLRNHISLMPFLRSWTRFDQNFDKYQAIDNHVDKQDQCREINLIPESQLLVKIPSTNGIIEADLGNNRTYLQPEVTLEDTKMINLAEQLWATYKTMERRGCAFHEYLFSGKRIRKMNQVVDESSTPKPILNEVRILCHLMEDQLNRRGSRSKTFAHGHIDDLVEIWNSDYNAWKNRANSYREIVWKRSGLIDYEKTALKALSHIQQEKLIFRIISFLCLESRLNAFPKDSVEGVKMEKIKERKPLVRYWRAYLQKTPDFVHEHSNLLTTLRQVSNPKIGWPAYEYFWDQFDGNDQIAIARKLIHANKFATYQMNLFSKLNRNQLRIMYSEAPIKILLNFIYSREYAVVKLVWNCVRHMLNGPQFEHLINEILKMAETKQTGDGVDCLVDIWNSAPQPLIDYVVHEKNCDIAERYFSEEAKWRLFDVSIIPLADSLRFLTAILCKTTVDYRKKYLVRKSHYLVSNYDTTTINSLMQSTLDVNDQRDVGENILQNVIKSELSDEAEAILDRFRKLLLSSLDEFDELLEIFTTNHDLKMKFQTIVIPRTLLDLNHGNFDANGWSNVSNLINEVYPDRNEALQKKKDIILTTSILRSAYKICIQNSDEKFDQIDAILKPILSENEIIIFKESLIKSLIDALDNRPISFLRKINLARLVEWSYCYNSDKISLFKSNLPWIQEVFRALLSEIIQHHTNGYPRNNKYLPLQPLDAFLCWVFPSTSSRNEFKENQIHAIIRENTADSVWKNYDRVLDEIIKWVFDEDELKICTFKNTYDKSQIMSIIHSCCLFELTTDREEFYNIHSDDELNNF